VLHIADPRERRLVAAADALLRVRAALGPLRTRVPRAEVKRILVLRLERIGDLMMSLPALHALGELAPNAAIDLVVGSWNEPLARLIPGIARIETLDAGWLSRGTGSLGLRAVLARARQWRKPGYDLAVNLEGDIRSNALLAASGAQWLAGFGMAGGGPLLDTVADFDPAQHTATHGVRLVREALGDERIVTVEPGVSALETAAALPKVDLVIPAEALQRAAALLEPAGRTRPLVGAQIGAGRAVKMWPPARYGDVAARLVADTDAAIVLTGAVEDALAAREFLARVPVSATVVNLVGVPDLVTLAAVLSRLSVLITPDTGPMHLAAVLGTPIVGVFGPSSPDRWGPLARQRRIVRIDLACSPCNRIRRPPERCVGHTPDCLEFIGVETVYQAARELLAARTAGRRETP